MRKTMENEKGYALLVVLFLIVFIMTVSALFMRGSLSNAKQEQRVDQNHLSVVAAEMGVDYYKSQFLNAYYPIRDDKWKEFSDGKQAILNDPNEKDPQGKIERLASQKRIELVGKLRNEFENIIQKELSPHKIQDYLEFSYHDFKSNSATDSHEVSVSGKVIGVYNPVNGDGESENVLSLNVFFEIPEFISGESNLSNRGTNSIDLSWITNTDKFPFIEKPSLPCNTPNNGKLPSNVICIAEDIDKIKKANNSTLYFEHNISKNNKGNVAPHIVGAKIYVQNNVEGSFNINGATNLQFYVKGSLNEYHNFKDFSKSKYFALGNMKVQQHMDINNSIIVTRGDLDSKQSLEVNNKSIVIINGKLVSNGKVAKVTGGSKVCVGGPVNLNEVSGDSSSYLYYVQGNGNPPRNSNLNYIPISPEAFSKDPNVLFENCAGASIKDIDEPTWINPVVDVTY
ncbi:hypothetical protein [Sporosarcina sp. UB5]|uniref:hypothetical protein n=1 Tax=Sporosarcina sp. UB5 TaxID=3047463 RepID=UPI003D7B499C